MKLTIKINTRKYGYITWGKSELRELEEFFKKRPGFNVWLNKKFIGRKKVNYKYNRLSIGPRKGASIPSEHNYLKFSLNKENEVCITTIR